MPATQAFVGRGAKIGYETVVGGGTYTYIGEVKSIKPPNPQSGEADATHLESPGNFKEFLQTMFDGGEASFTINLIPDGSSWSAIQAKRASGVRENWQVLFANTAGSEVVFPAFIKGTDVSEVTSEGVVEATITLRVTGDWAWS